MPDTPTRSIILVALLLGMAGVGLAVAGVQVAFGKGRSWEVDPGTARVIGWAWRNPPTRGDIVIVDGQRCQVTRCRVRWEGSKYEILELRVRDASDG